MKVNELIILRGLPGSGKSTFAKNLQQWNHAMKHFEADMFFSRNGEYCFVPELLHAAHTWCSNMTRDSLIQGFDVIVSNTFTTKQEVEYYIVMAKSLNKQFTVMTVENWHGSSNIHNVPQKSLEKMQARYFNKNGF